MKRLLLCIAFVSLFALPAQASNEEVCNILADIAHATMEARQSGASQFQMIGATNSFEPNYKLLVDQIIVSAFESPKYEDYLTQQVATDVFRGEIRFKCMLGLSE